MNNKTLIGAIIALALVIGVAVVAYPSLSVQQQSARPQSTSGAAAQTVGDFEVIDADGNTTSFSHIAAGKPAYINFWATWCPYCVDEMDDIQDLYDEYGKDVQFVIIDSVDGQRETTAMGKAYIAEHGYTFPAFYDEAGEALEEFAITAYPTSVLVASDGNVVQTIPGRFDKKTLSNALQQLS